MGKQLLEKNIWDVYIWYKNTQNNLCGKLYVKECASLGFVFRMKKRESLQEYK